MSWVWSSICHGLDILKEHAHWDIMNGRYVNAFSYNWILNPSLPLCVNQPNPNFKVSEFIMHDTREWNVPLVQAFFTRENCLKICIMRVPISGNDTLVWPYNKNGSLTVKSVYKLLANKLPHNSTNNTDIEVYMAIWKSPLLPRTQLFLWKCVENIIPTGSKLARYNRNHDDRCKVCNSDVVETPEHMIPQCSFSRNVWSNIPIVSNLILQDMNFNISLKDWITKWLTSSQFQTHLVTAMNTAWCIWKDRCFKVFEDKTPNPQITARTSLRISEDISNNLVSTPNTNATHSVHDNNSDFLYQISQNNLILYCDASFDKDTNNSGIGIVAMNNAGEFKGCKLVYGRKASCEDAESDALLEAAKWIKEKNLQDVYLVSDAKNVVAYLNNVIGQASWTSCSILDGCLFLLQNINLIRFKHVKRSFNVAADIAAKHSRVGNVSGEWDRNNCPHFLQDIVNSR
ncbi:uncharacterized protein LOC113331883 [Papaver somniferum]|uniref:uncharacterized protein LOC113331883 n=1 Tax=Papaver somniferum TaxID=3469 RepID=UPI000E6F6163|nr:uncharacterized protein LOC113331883 [Papaver somniferum]